MAEKIPSTVVDPLRESLVKVTGLDPASTSTGTSPINYPADYQSRGDIVNISQAPGLMYTPAEQWAHELGLAQLELDKQKTLGQLGLEREKFELTKKAADFESMMDAVQFSDYMMDRNRGRGATLRVAGGGGGGYGRFQPSSGIRPAPAWTSNPGPRGGLAAWNNPARYGGAQRYLNGVPVVQTELAGPALGTMYNQISDRARRENREMPIVVQKKRPWTGR